MPSQNQRIGGENYEHPSNHEFENKNCSMYRDEHITWLVLGVPILFLTLFFFVKIFPTCRYTNLTYYEHIITSGVNKAELQMSIP